MVLPFLTRLYPRARYVVLTRHPLAVASSYANSFFALTTMAGFSKPDELRKRPSDAFGPFGVGLTLGVAWRAP